MMFYSIPFLTFLFLTLSATPCRSASPGDKWKIGNPTFSYQDLKFELVFEVSTLVDDSNLVFTLWDDQCEQGFNEITSNNYVNGVLEETSASRNNGEDQQKATKEIGVGLTLNPNTISQAPIYSESAEQPSKATIRLCVRFSEYTGDPTLNPEAIEVNFLETVLELHINFSNGSFSIDNMQHDS
jgi:hypothetical protein